jgi:hypothetical protein
MSHVQGKLEPVEQVTRLRVIRADGTVEKQYVAAYWHKSFWRRWLGRYKHKLVLGVIKRNIQGAFRRLNTNGDGTRKQG